MNGTEAYYFEKSLRKKYPDKEIICIESFTKGLMYIVDNDRKTVTVAGDEGTATFSRYQAEMLVDELGRFSLNKDIKERWIQCKRSKLSWENMSTLLITVERNKKVGGRNRIKLLGEVGETTLNAQQVETVQKEIPDILDAMKIKYA